MRRIVICFDGTWNQVRKPKRITNVVKFAQAVKPVASDGVAQIVYYNSGVGTGDLLDRILGGVFGRGIEANVKRALAFLALNYQAGDEIYIVGFSRGSYSARALGGVIGAAGVPLQAEFEQIERVWNYYRAKKRDRTGLEALVVKPRIRCIAVWDTVGSYGVPAGFGLGGLMRMFAAWTRGFHDNYPGTCIDIGLHALAIDEKRRPFAPTLWTWPKAKLESEPPKSHIEQVWFPGAHANVGGSYPDSGLSDLALVWTMARIEALGRDRYGSTLDFNIEAIVQHLQPNIEGRLYRSERGWPVSMIWPYVRPVLLRDRALDPSLVWNGETDRDVHLGERVHWSAVQRHGAAMNPAYRPRRVTFPPAAIAEITPEEQRILKVVGSVRTATRAPGGFDRAVAA